MDSSMHDRGLAASRLGDAVETTGKEIWRPGDLARIGVVAAILLRALVGFLIHSAAARLAGRHRGMIELGECITSTFETLGGGFVKIGQILSHPYGDSRGTGYALAPASGFDHSLSGRNCPTHHRTLFGSIYRHAFPLV